MFSILSYIEISIFVFGGNGGLFKELPAKITSVLILKGALALTNLKKCIDWS